MIQVVKGSILGGLVAACVISTGCSSEAASPQQAPRGPDAVPVTVARVVQKAVPLEIRVVGNVEAYSTVAIHAQITGELTSVNFKEGDDVQAGQILFTLDQRPLEAAVAQAQATLDRDVTQAANLKTQAERYQALSQRGLVSGQEVQANTTAATAAEASVNADRAVLQNAKVQLQYATIAAPIAGRTGTLIVHPGNLVRANDTTPLVVINQVSPVNVAFGIPEADLSSFKRYLAAHSLRVEATPPNDTDPASLGEIAFIDNAVDPTTGTIKIKGTFSNVDRRLWPGQFVNVIVTLATDAAAIVVPTVAVQASDEGQYVFVVKPDQTVDVRTITISRTNGAETLIKDGLKAGESVVTDGQVRLVKGSRVSIKTGLNDKVAG